MYQFRTSGSVELHIDYLPVINYATLLNGGKIISSFSIKNVGQHLIKMAQICVKGYYFPQVNENIGVIQLDETKNISLELLPEINNLLLLNEAVYTEFQIIIFNGENEIASFRFPITIQAWNHWVISPDSYHHVASFVMPHHPYVIDIIEKAGKYLQKKSCYSIFNGYNVPDFGDVVEQVRAIWEALVSEHLKFITINSNYIDIGQKILTPDMIARNRHGNCLDLSLLFCSCLERIGLSPCLVFFPGHVVAGIWMYPNHHITNPITTASGDIANCATGDDPILLVAESTAMCGGAKFDEAVESAVSLLKRVNIKFTVDIVNSRKSGVRSLPLNNSSMPLPENFEIKGCSSNKDNSSRRIGWERKLLDLTLRNTMLNLKTGKTIVPVFEEDTAKIVKHIKENTLTTVIGKPGKDNMELLKNLYRAARTSLEENGANSLFVSLGSLRWFDIDDPTPHIAPLLFIPVSIVRKRAMTYEIRLREDEAMVNVTLIEMLRQMFGVDFPELETLPEDSDGFPDWQKVFNVFNKHVLEINKRQPHNKQWEMPIHSYIGIFSFTKFLMWHDIHFYPHIIENHHVLKGFINNRYEPEMTQIIDIARKLESNSPLNLMLPLDYDSSQLEAVAESHAGHSFVLHGPPGTGKSQTITNIIANALYAGKRVLFVAEKKAALDVVRSRLNSINLSPFCLELHSNKTDKRSFFTQVQESAIHHFNTANETPSPSPDYLLKAETLNSVQQHLIEITQAIHSAREHGLSLYDYINNLLSVGYSNLALSFADVKNLSPSHINELCVEFSSLDLVAQIIGYHPGTSNLVGLYPRENTAQNQNDVTETLAQMPAAIAKARKKAASLFNRWFSKLSPEQILTNDNLWKKLKSVAALENYKCTDINAFEKNVERWNNAVHELRRWYHFSEKAAEITKYHIPKALDHYLQGNTGKQSADALQGAYYRTMAYYAIDNDSALRGFSGPLYEEKISRFRANVEDFQKLQRLELVRKMTHNIANSALSPEQEKQLAILSRRLQTNGRGVALRKVIADSSDILAKLFPCMLMSPLSVAQYLDMMPSQFDIVIFDEASQMETPDAVGTIARGENLIVVGDPLQLPPTRFFTSQTSSGEEVEESEDSNSILEDCIALGMSSRYLSRHYRSKHESLIAFSNNYFYENKLLTFPSINDSQHKVSFINPNGVYDYGKTRTNKTEAEAVVKHLIELFENSQIAPSVGVVAFSKAQSNLIEDILNSKLHRNKALQKKIDEAPEPLFIKNLENVQGDERDIIIFSIGYGPDKNGNVSLNFGPLNQSGGERRLNVAVSRARREMIVFSSLLPSHIPSDDFVPKGVASLRNFLSYAISGNLPNKNLAEGEKEIIVENIAEKLRENGLDVVTKVGRSSFKIDIAIIDKQNPGNYKLGLILDGRDYFNIPTVRDREITIPAILNSLGWSIHRIWVIDWLENPNNVIAQILSQIQQPGELSSLNNC